MLWSTGSDLIGSRVVAGVIAASGVNGARRLVPLVSGNMAIGSEPRSRFGDLRLSLFSIRLF